MRAGDGMNGTGGGGAEAIDGSWELPEGWVWTNVRIVLKLRSQKISPAEYPRMPFVGMDDIAPHSMKISGTRPFAEMRSAGNAFKVGDILYGRLRPYLNKTAVAAFEGAASGELLSLIPAKIIEAKYAQLFLHFRYFTNRVMAQISGDRPRADYDDISTFPFPLPPLPEQRRIVARIEELFAEIDEGEAALRRAKAGLQTQRRSLLKAAVTGALTEDWRAANPPKETGADLLARLRAERAARGGKRSKPLPKADASGLPELAEGWTWATLGEMFQVFTGATPSRAEPDYWNGSVPWVSSGEVAFCRIRTTKETISEAGLNNSSARVNPPGTLLLAMIGEGKTRGQCAVLDLPAANNQNAAAIRVSETPVPPDFVYWVLRSRYEALRSGSQGGNQPALNAAKVSEITIPLPSLDEMAKILERLADALSAVDETEALIAAQLKNVAALRQSVLKAAFEGRLMPQDPADEPASALLARFAPPTPACRRGRQPKR